MQTIETLKATGELLIEVRNEQGQLVEKRHVPNMVVTVGKNWIVDRMLSNGSAVMSHMAVGSGNTAPALGQTALTNQLARIPFNSINQVGNTVTFVAVYNAGVGTGSLTEAGIFNAATNGTMLARTTFGTLTKASDDVVTVSWTITIS